MTAFCLFALVVAIFLLLDYSRCMRANDGQTDGQSDRWDKLVHERANQYVICDRMELKEMIVLIICKLTK
jgi:hypothetical protein